MHQNLEQMKINSNNYEEFFLLYADNELTESVRAEVEKFVEEHPDLRDELYLFAQTKLPVEDALVYPCKAGLFKHIEPGVVNENNYSEYFLLYTDNELNAEERKAVEAFAATHKEKQAELTLLQRVKLAPEENIVFSNKDILYRTTQKPVRIISMRWISVAAAAAVLLTGIAVWTNIYDNETAETDQHAALAGKPSGIKEVKKAQEDIKPQLTEPLNDVVAEEKQAIAATEKIEQPRNTINYPVATKETGIVEPAVNNIQEKTVDREKSITNLIAGVPSDERREEALYNKTIADKQIALNDIAKPSATVKPLILDQQAFNGEDKSTLQNEMENNENIVFLDTDNNEKKPKGKLRGLFRKASRFVDHVTNTGNENDQSVVRVASFEIAKK